MHNLFHELQRQDTSRMLKKSASFVLASLSGSTFWTRCNGKSNGYPEYASPLRSLRPGYPPGGCDGLFEHPAEPSDRTCALFWSCVSRVSKSLFNNLLGRRMKRAVPPWMPNAAQDRLADGTRHELSPRSSQARHGGDHAHTHHHLSKSKAIPTRRRGISIMRWRTGVQRRPKTAGMRSGGSKSPRWTFRSCGPRKTSNAARFGRASAGETSSQLKKPDAAPGGNSTSVTRERPVAVAEDEVTR
jgi:hypothetical protein